MTKIILNVKLARSRLEDFLASEVVAMASSVRLSDAPDGAIVHIEPATLAIAIALWDAILPGETVYPGPQDLSKDAVVLKEL